MGGKTLYFGEIGGSSKTLTSYFEHNGARPCGQDENPAEWMLEVTGLAPGSEHTQDWPAIWHNSEERRAVKAEISRMKRTLSQQPVSVKNPDALRPFAAPFGTQLWTVLTRVFQQYWRTPSYLYSKIALCLFSVTPNPSKAACKVSNIKPGNVHRILLLENSKLAPGATKPTLRRLHAPHDILQLLSTNHAPFRDPTRPLRSPGTSIQGLLVASVHAVEYPRRDLLELPHGCARLCKLVLPHRTAPECRGGRSGGRKRSTDVLVYSDVLDLRWDFYEYGYCGN